MKIAAITDITGQYGSVLAKQLLEKDYFIIGMKRMGTLYALETIKIMHDYDKQIGG